MSTLEDLNQGIRLAKFGGTSVGTKAGRNFIASIVEGYLREAPLVAVVASAFSKVTDDLILIARTAAKGDETYRQMLDAIVSRHREVLSDEAGNSSPKDTQLEALIDDVSRLLYGIHLVRDLSPRSLDYVVSFGERMSATVLASVLSAKGLPATAVDARELIVTDEAFGRARVDRPRTIERIQGRFTGQRGVYVVTGFIASSATGETTTLGRGGSDYTAALFGEALRPPSIDIWKDVDGFLTADPARVPTAFVIPRLSYEEAMELCHFGAKVIYPPAIQPAMDGRVPVRVKNTYHPDAPGSVISSEAADVPRTVTGISSLSSVQLYRLEGSGMVGVSGIAQRLFGVIARANISVILISQASSEHSICFAVAPDGAERTKAVVDAEFAPEIASREILPLLEEGEFSVVAVVGEHMRNSPGIAARLFSSLGKNGINVTAIAQGSSERNISVVVRRRDEAKTLNVLHDAFFLSGTKTVHLFMVGAGRVGGELLRQLAQQAETVKREQLVDLKLIGLIRRERMLILPDGIPFSAWEQTFEDEAAPSNLDTFIDAMAGYNLSNALFVDCSASEEIGARYEDILRTNVSIVTPNKKGHSGPLARYKSMRELTSKGTVKCFFETTVGAGLPVIGTLGDLLVSGDVVARIEAVLSGTLSYVFNSYRGDMKFSDVIREAHEKGYTEPDPRDDLSGLDFGRKLLILAREIGLDLELSEIEIESLVPRPCQEAATVDEFFRVLCDFDDYFGDLRKKAEAQGRVLRYMGRITDGRAQVSLQAVEPTHPFFALSGSDNIISFWTERYSERPLVVRGPGAGTGVTAAGVFADILRAAGYMS